MTDQYPQGYPQGYPQQGPPSPQSYPQAPQGYPQPQQMPQQGYPQQMPPVPGVPPVDQGQWPTQNVAPQAGGFMDTETIDWRTLREEANQELQPMPIADYPAMVTSASGLKASTGKPMLKIIFKIMSGPYAGRPQTRNMTVTRDSENAMRMFFRQMDALGFTQEYFNSLPNNIEVALSQIAADLPGRQAMLAVSQKEHPPQSGIMINDVKMIKPLTGPGMFGAAQPFAGPPMPQPQYVPQQPYQPQQFNQAPPPQAAPPLPPALTQQPQYQQPQPPQYAQPQYSQNVAPQQYPIQPDQQQVMVDWPPEEAQQAPPQAPQQLQPTQQIPVGPEHAQMPPQAPQAPQAPQQAAPQPPVPPVPGQPGQPQQPMLPTAPAPVQQQPQQPQPTSQNQQVPPPVPAMF